MRMKCRNCGEWIFESTTLETGKAAVTDPFLVERGLVSPEKAKTTKTIRHEEYFVCPKCGWKERISQREIISIEAWAE
jgi:rubredoxin